MPNNVPRHLGRRAILKGTSLLLAAGAHTLNPHLAVAAQTPSQDAVRFGMVTDLHYADKPAAGGRHYRATLDKLAEAVEKFRKDPPNFVVELGDLIDSGPTADAELAFLKRVDREFAAASKDRHYVLGNHCVEALTKAEFLGAVGQKLPHYSFDRGGVHFVVLDACYRADGEPYGRKNSKWTDANVSADQLDWLQGDLKASKKFAVVFCHQRLDVGGDYGVRNAAEVRKALERSGKVLAVFQGHSHKNDYKEINGVHYCTLAAMIEGAGAEDNGYATVEVRPSGAIEVRGFRKQKSYDWSAKK